MTQLRPSGFSVANEPGENKEIHITPRVLNVEEVEMVIGKDGK
jgi:hypothetical protein